MRPLFFRDCCEFPTPRLADGGLWLLSDLLTSSRNLFEILLIVYTSSTAFCGKAGGQNREHAISRVFTVLFTKF